MPLLRFRALLLSATLAIGGVAAPVGAVTLGEFVVSSGQGEPLRGEIELDEMTGDTPAGTVASVASPQTYAALGLVYPDALRDARTAIARRAADGRWIVRVDGVRPIADRGLIVVMQVERAEGRQWRTYRIEPGSVRASRGSPVAEGAVARVEPVATPGPVSGAPAAAAEPAPPASSASAAGVPSVSPPPSTPLSTTTAASSSTAPSASPAPPTSTAPLAADTASPPTPTPTPNASTVSPTLPASSAASSSPAPAAAAEPAPPRTATARAAPSTDRPASAARPATIDVAPGDTATSIARRIKPDDVTDEQAVMALYRENERTFAGNVHRLPAGAVLVVPSDEQLRTLPPARARRALLAQGPLSRAETAGDAGDRLRLSGGGQGRATGPSGRGGNGDAQRDIAFKTAMAEANARLGHLESIIEQLREMIALRERQISGVVAQLDAAGRPAAPMQASAAATPPGSAAPLGAATATLLPAPSRGAAASPMPEPEPVPERSSLPSPTLIALAAGALASTAAVVWWLRRRRRADDEDDMNSEPISTGSLWMDSR